MRPLSPFESSVLGAVGRVGDRCSAVPPVGAEMVEAVADILEEPDGTGFVVQLEGELHEVSSVLVVVETADGARVGAVAPFADADGRFVLEVPASEGRTAFFVANGALVDPPDRAYVRLVLRDDRGEVRGHTAFALNPSASEPVAFPTYARPFAELAWAIALADGALAPVEVTQIGLQLRTLLGEDDDGVAALSLPPEEPPGVSALAVSLSCRFAELDREELFFALLGVAASDGEVSPAEIGVLRKVARRLDVPEPTWQKWAYRMGVDLPDLSEIDPSDLRIDNRPPIVVLAERHGRRVPSIILRLDREGQDRRNVFATISLLVGALAVALWLGSVGLVLAPPGIAAVLAPLAGLVQMGVAASSVATGWLALRVARETGGAGQGAATSGLALGVVSLMLGLVWWMVVCLGIGATAYWDQQGN